MALPFRIARAIVGVVKETTAGTYAEPAAGDSFHAENITVKPTQNTTERSDTRTHFGKLDDIPGGAEVEIGFEIYLVGAAAAGTDPFWHTAMMACGHQRITVGVTSVTYKPTTKFDGSGTTTLYPSEAYSISVWEEANGPRYSIEGGIGSVQLVAKVNEPLKLKFTFKGSYSATIDDATPPTVTDSTLQPPVFAGAQITLQSLATAEFDGFEFDKGNEISKRIDAADPNGIKAVWITGHAPMVKVSPHMLTVATHDFFGKWRLGTVGNFQTAVIGGTAGNRVQITATRVQYKELGLGDREGGRTIDIGAAIKTAAGAADGDDYSIILT